MGFPPLCGATSGKLKLSSQIMWPACLELSRTRNGVCYPAAVDGDVAARGRFRERVHGGKRGKQARRPAHPVWCERKPVDSGAGTINVCVCLCCARSCISIWLRGKMNVDVWIEIKSLYIAH